MPNPKNGEKIPSLIVFGRIRGSKVDQAAVFLEKDAEAAKRAASDAGLSSLEVQTEADRNMAAALPEGAINAQGRFSLSPASPEIIAELDRLLKAATGQEATLRANDDETNTCREFTLDAFSLSPITVVARVLASQLTSASRISSATASAVFAPSNATCVMMLGSRKYAICASLRSATAS